MMATVGGQTGGKKQGQAKELVSQASTAHEALIDLKRHCAQSSAYDKHSAGKKVLNLT